MTRGFRRISWLCNETGTVGEAMGRKHVPLDDRKVDLNLVESGVVNRGAR